TTLTPTMARWPRSRRSSHSSGCRRQCRGSDACPCSQPDLWVHAVRACEVCNTTSAEVGEDSSQWAVSHSASARRTFLFGPCFRQVYGAARRHGSLRWPIRHVLQAPTTGKVASTSNTRDTTGNGGASLSRLPGGVPAGCGYCFGASLNPSE